MSDQENKKRKRPFVQHSSTYFLRFVVLAFALMVLALCLVGLPAGLMSDRFGPFHWLLVALYLPAIPFFYAVFQTMKLLGYIDEERAFSEESVAALRAIKYSGVIIAGLFGIFFVPYLYFVVDKEITYGLVPTGLVIMGASVVISVFAAVLQKLLKSALDIKSENDLTV